MNTSVLGMGLGWGLAPWVVVGRSGSPLVGVTVLLFVLGAAGVNVVFNAASRLRFHLYQSAVFVPALAWLWARPEPLLERLGWLGLALCGLNTLLQDANHRAMLGAVSGTLANADLLEQADRDRCRIESANALLLDQSQRDELTGLLNRKGFTGTLDAAIAASAGDQHFAVLIADLDRFKIINESLGHGVGDEVLRIMGGRVASHVPSGGVVARLGADEFVIAVPCPAHAALRQSTTYDLVKRAEAITELISAPMDVAGQPSVLSASVGLAVGPEHGHSADELLRHADAALMKAKAAGRDRIEVFDDTIRSRIARRVSEEQALRRAIDDGDIVPYYQPLVDASTGKVVGAELLARWLRDGRVIPAGAFIGLAEETGLVDRLSERVIEAGIVELRAWERDGLPELFRLSVNLPPRFVSASGRLGRLADLLNTEPLDRLCLEVTETAVVDDLDLAAARLDALRTAGAHVALDDFGTGNASLTLLQRMPLDHVKLDRSFVTDIVDDLRDRSLVKGFVAMARGLGLSVVGEGVETVEQAQVLVDLGCTIHQGWLYDQAVPGERFVELLRGTYAGAR